MTKAYNMNHDKILHKAVPLSGDYCNYQNIRICKPVTQGNLCFVLSILFETKKAGQFVVVEAYLLLVS